MTTKLDYAIDYITPYFKTLTTPVQKRFMQVKSQWARNCNIKGSDQAWCYGVVKYLMIKNEPRRKKRKA